MNEYSVIVNRISNYNNLPDMKIKFINSILNCTDFELDEYEDDINSAIKSHRCNSTNGQCDEIDMYNYGISVIKKIKNERYKKSEFKNFGNININSNNTINSNNNLNKDKDSLLSKYWWKLIIPVIIGIIIWYLSS